MTENTQLDLECRMHALLCGSLNDIDRQELLSRILHDEQARSFLEVCLAEQQQVRAAFGYDQADDIMQASMRMLKPKLADIDTGRRGVLKWMMPARRWLVRMAAVAAIGVSVYVASWAARTDNSVVSQQMADLSNRMQDVLQRVSDIQTLPAIDFSASDRQRYHDIWKLASGEKDIWVLVSNETAEFGSLAEEPQGQATDNMLVFGCRILDDHGRVTYRKDLLLPDLATIRETFSPAGSMNEHPVSLAISKIGNRASVGFALGAQGTIRAGVTGEVSIDENRTDPLGQFAFDGHVFRVFIRTQRLSGFRS